MHIHHPNLGREGESFKQDSALVYTTHQLLVESSNASSDFPEIFEVICPTLPPLDLTGGTKLPRTPRRETPYDLVLKLLLATLLSL